MLMLRGFVCQCEWGLIVQDWYLVLVWCCMVIDDKESIDGCIKIDINGNYFNNKEGKIMMIFGDGLISFVWFL